MVTSNDQIRDKMRRLRFYGMDKTYYSLEHGYNSRLDELHAAILGQKLLHIEEYIARRRDIAHRYDTELRKSDLILPIEANGNRHAYYLYVVRHAKRDARILIAHLREDGLEIGLRMV